MDKCNKKDDLACDCYTEGVNDAAKYVIELQEENKKLKELLTKTAKGTHKCKELYDWHCEEQDK